MSHLPKLYCAWYCPFAQRAWIAIEEKGVEYEYVETDPYDKTPEWLAVSPRGTVPALLHNGDNIYESQIVIEYLEDAWPNTTPSMLPKQPAGRARCRVWTDHVSKNIVSSFNKILLNPEAETAEHRTAMLNGIVELVGAMDKSGPFFDSGAAPNMVDAMMFPFAYRTDVVLSHWRNFNVPGPETDSIWARYHKWYQAMLARPAVKNTVPERDAIIERNKRYIK